MWIRSRALRGGERGARWRAARGSRGGASGHRRLPGMPSRPAPNPLLLGALIVFAAVVALTGGCIALQPGGRFDVAVAGLGLACAVSIAAGARRDARMRLQGGGALLLA